MYGPHRSPIHNVQSVSNEILGGDKSAEFQSGSSSRIMLILFVECQMPQRPVLVRSTEFSLGSWT